MTQSFASTGIDASNSTNTPLGISGVATGTFVDVSSYSNVSIMIFADQPSATGGFVIQYSSDGVNVDDNDMFTIPASNGQQYSFPLPGKYYRIIYTNGSVAQTIFRLQAKLHAVRPKPSSQRIGTAINAEQDAEVVVTTNGRFSLTASAPATASIGVTSTTVIVANTSRKGLVIQNTSSLATISLNLVGGAAVLNSGVTLFPHDTYYMDEWSFTTAQINAIASIAATPVSIQEFTG